VDFSRNEGEMFVAISVRLLAVMAVAVVLSGCTTTKRMADVHYHPPARGYRLIVMAPEVEVGLVTAGGVLEPRQDWTTQAHDSVVKALIAQQSGHGGNVIVVSSLSELRYDPTKLRDLMALHRVVGLSIGLHKYSGAFLWLPTKSNHFDWTLGSEAVKMGSALHYDYALFVRAQDSFESSGRAALRVASILLGGAPLLGGQQLAYASLVDLKSGQVVWFNVLRSSVGDIRTPEGASKMVNNLLEGMSSEQ
jgi:hypothetical protein